MSCSLYIVTIIYLNFVCYQALYLSSFCRATDIRYHSDYWIAVLLSSKALENVSTWIILLPFLYSMVKSYCWSLHNYQALLLNSKSTVCIVFRVMWSVIILKGFMPKYCLNFSTFHITAKHSYSIIRYFFLCSLKVLLV